MQNKGFSFTLKIKFEYLSCSMKETALWSFSSASAIRLKLYDS